MAENGIHKIEYSTFAEIEADFIARVITWYSVIVPRLTRANAHGHAFSIQFGKGQPAG